MSWRAESMPKPISSRSVSAAQVLAYAKKAQEFTDAAISELNAGRFTSACSLAVHAGISAADAVCGARVGQRAAGKEHNQVLVLLGKAGRDGAEIERELGRLLPLKTNAEYEPDDISRSTAAKAVERATRCTQVAQRVANAIR